MLPRGLSRAPLYAADTDTHMLMSGRARLGSRWGIERDEGGSSSKGERRALTSTGAHARFLLLHRAGSVGASLHGECADGAEYSERERQSFHDQWDEDPAACSAWSQRDSAVQSKACGETAARVGLEVLERARQAGEVTRPERDSSDRDRDPDRPQSGLSSGPC